MSDNRGGGVACLLGTAVGVFLCWHDWPALTWPVVTLTAALGLLGLYVILRGDRP